MEKQWGSEVVVELVKSLKLKYNVNLILEVLNIPKSSYYRWKNKDFKMAESEYEIIKLCKNIISHMAIENN